MTGTGEAAPVPDPDATGVLPAYADNASTHVFPAVRPDPARSVGYPVDPAAATIESAAIRYPYESDTTIEQPASRSATEYPGGTGYSGAVPTPAPTAEDTGAAVAKHGSVMALGSIASRVTGFVRTAAIGAAIGVVAIGNDYSLANTLPGMVYELLLGGVLASVVVPLLVRARTKDTDKGEAYAQRLLSLAVIFLAGATVVAVACAPLFTALLANDRTAPADRELITTLSYLLLPMIFFYGMAALFAAILNTRGHFATPTFAPILNNLVVIAMCGVFVLAPLQNKDDAASLTGGQIAILGLGTTLGIVVQAAGLWPALRRVGFRWRWRWDFRELHLRELGRVGTWMLAYVVVSQVAVVVVFKLAQMAADNGENAAGPAIYNNAFLIFMMAHGIIAVSIITALMPRMAAAAAEQRTEDLVHQLSLGTRLAAVVLIPATVAYVVLGRPLAVTLVRVGSVRRTRRRWRPAGSSRWPGWDWCRSRSASCSSSRSTRCPTRRPRPHQCARGGAAHRRGSAVVRRAAGGIGRGRSDGWQRDLVRRGGALGYVLLRRRIGPLGLSSVFATLGRLGLAALIAAVPTVFVVIVLTVVWGDGKGASSVQLVVGALVLFAAYLGAAVALRVREVSEVTAMVRGRLGR